MIRLSVVLAVYNEEANLKICLESVKELADEFVVVDGGSQDKTVEIAKKYGAKIIQTDNPSNFHINKNKAIDVALGDWVLQLDADEVVTEELKDEIKQTISSKRDYNGYWIKRKNFFLGKFLTKGGQYPDYTLRLYRRGKGRLPAKSVHEQAEVSGKVGYLKHPLLHLRDKNFSIYILRFNRYTDILAEEIRDVGVKMNAISSVKFLFLKPLVWFLKVYFRHLGFLDGFPGFIFALFSALRFPVAFLKFWMEERGSK